VRRIRFPSLTGLGDGQLASRLKLDSLYDVNGLKRYLGSGFEVLYPSAWLQDVTLFRRRVEQAEFSRGLDFQDIDQMERAARGRSVVQPSIAFGPAGGSGEDNISIISAPSPGLRCGPNKPVQIICGITSSVELSIFSLVTFIHIQDQFCKTCAGCKS
jgi:hypothetical protein